jgi:uncharacterized glyoxalase superfamily protein PhnB
MQELTPILNTEDVQGSVDYYTSVLGFTCEAGGEETAWARVSRDDVSVMFARPTVHQHFIRPTFTGSLYLRTDDVDAVWEQLKDKVEICYPIENFHYGMREFAIYDNNRYLLQFGQEIPADPGKR